MTLPRRVMTMLLVTAAFWASATPAQAAPIYLGWSALLPAWTTSYSPSSADDCAAGREQCVNKVIRELEREYQQFRSTCDHRSAFALGYLRTTEQFRRVNAQPGFFSDPNFLNHQDAVFAEFYFTAAQAWQSGDYTKVPPAWQVAFRAAQQREVSAAGDMMLGMNAHISNDLPFVLAAIGLTKPDGSSRKPDHDQVNVFLNQVVAPLIDEMAASLDPSLKYLNSPLYLSYTVFMQSLSSWREQAWRYAEMLANATTDSARETVASMIEQNALTNAALIKTQFAYLPPLTSTTMRDAFCQLTSAS